MRDARRWGIQREYTDARGERHEASDESITAVLDAMGAVDDAPLDATTIVMRSDGVVPEEIVEVRLEDGVEVDLTDDEPRVLPPGYHVGIARDGTERALIVSPGRCWLPAALSVWGWAVQLYAARSSRSWGIGDLADLRTIATWSRDVGADVLLLNPLHAATPGTGEPSPYYPTSRRVRDPLYIAVEEVPGAEELDDLEEVVAAGRALNASDTIDRTAVYEVKMAALERLWSRRRDDRGLDDFRAQNDGLEDLATHMALAERLGHHRSQWPKGLRERDASAVVRWTEENRERVEFHIWLQWLLDRQLETAAAEIGLVHDLPVGIDPRGADAWLWQDVLPTGVTVGAPPDDFSATGQNWGLPPFDPWKLRAAGYQPFVETIRSALSHGIGLRIDHVMGLFRLWWVPEDMSAADGVYVRYPSDDLLNIVALESQRARSLIVGEDLGTVEEGVREEMFARKMLSYRVLWFEEGPPEDYPRLALAAVTNHDLPTIAGVWTGADLDEQRDLGLYVDEHSVIQLGDRLRNAAGADHVDDLDDVIRGANARLAAAPSMITIATLDDAMRATRRPNIPGTSTEQRPNWSLPLPAPLDDLGGHALAGSVAAAVTAAREGAG
ncbi:MAG: 4-alpha-glucanotransferase [Actinomycetota bacterium]